MCGGRELFECGSRQSDANGVRGKGHHVQNAAGRMGREVAEGRKLAAGRLAKRRRIVEGMLGVDVYGYGCQDEQVL